MSFRVAWSTTCRLWLPQRGHRWLDVYWYFQRTPLPYSTISQALMFSQQSPNPPPHSSRSPPERRRSHPRWLRNGRRSAQSTKAPSRSASISPSHRTGISGREPETTSAVSRAAGPSQTSLHQSRTPEVRPQSAAPAHWTSNQRPPGQKTLKSPRQGPGLPAFIYLT